ncbi:uncharacterized protein LOC124690790 [Lolium rigidum]|uniref:uncharacterized protein LOC124690790 n=1 Tax=Lolium rigidum TaxID=89674 RepID=UPI001F5D2ABF|nr:uncharacterized protein LOC124690790 [Lolium rigidum]
MAASLRCPHSPATGPLDDDDLLREVLLRLPPQPSSLSRASAVCRRWRRLVSDAGFCRRFRIHHRRNPPLLGFFHRYQRLPFLPTLEAPNRIPPGRFSLQRDDGDHFLSLGCRHGLLLILLIKRLQVLVWDPVTGDQHRVAIPPWIAARAEKTVINGAVFRASGDVQFQVVLVMADGDHNNCRRAFACAYSSHTGLWGDLISTPITSEVLFQDAAVMVGNSLYWLLDGGILEFDLERQRLAVIQVPVLDISVHDDFTITRAEGGGLGCLLLLDFTDQLWNRKTDCNGVAAWVLARTIELDKLLSLNPDEKRRPLTIVGFAECNNVVFMRTVSGIFMIQLESLLQFKKFPETSIMFGHPFESVYASGNCMP